MYENGHRRVYIAYQHSINKYVLVARSIFLLQLSLWSIQYRAGYTISPSAIGDLNFKASSVLPHIIRAGARKHGTTLQSRTRNPRRKRLRTFAHP